MNEASGGPEPGQGHAASGDRKKRLGLVDQRAGARWLLNNYTASERRGCGRMGLAVSIYRYESKRTDEPLRTKLVKLAREKSRFGYRRLHVLLRRSGEQVNHKKLHRIDPKPENCTRGN